MNPSWTAQHHASQLSTASTMGCSLTTSFVLLLYDHALTFGDEVNEFWTLRPSPTGALILIVRYFALLSRGLDVFAFFYTGWTPTSCSTMKKIEFPIVSSVITIALVHMIMLLRIFALYGAHAPILASLILLLVGEVVIILIASYVINPWDSSVPGCLLGRAPSNTTSSLYWTIPIIDDTIIFILTLKKSKQYAKLTKGIPISLMKVFLRDGFLYYLILGILHALNALLFLFAPPALKGVASGFLQSIATITISRLLFNLRMRARQEHSNNGLTAQTFETGATTKSMVNLTTVCSIFTRFNAGRESDIPDHSSGIHALRSSPSNMGAIHLLPTVATERIRSGGGRSFEIQVDGPYYG